MDLPTYTNIWRIEKRLYKLYDFRLPTPLPVVTLGVFLGVCAVWFLLMGLLRVPFAQPWHVFWLVPPLVITFFATRPVIEGKRLTEVLLSQMRFLTEARVYTRLAPEREPGEVTVTARVWHRHPAAGPLPAVRKKPERKRAKKKATKKGTTRARSPETATLAPEEGTTARGRTTGPQELERVLRTRGVEVVDAGRGGPASPKTPLTHRPDPDEIEEVEAHAAAAPARGAQPAEPEGTWREHQGEREHPEEPEPAAEPEPASGSDEGDRPDIVPFASDNTESPSQGPAEQPLRIRSGPATPESTAPPPEERAQATSTAEATSAPERGAAPADTRAIGTRILNYFGFALHKLPEQQDAPTKTEHSRRERPGTGATPARDERQLPEETVGTPQAQPAVSEWFGSLRSSSGHTPYPLSSKAAYQAPDTGPMAAPDTAEDSDGEAEERATAADRQRVRRRAEEMMAAPEPDGDQRVRARATPPTQNGAAAQPKTGTSEGGSAPDGGASPQRRLRGRSQSREISRSHERERPASPTNTPPGGPAPAERRHTPETEPTGSGERERAVPPPPPEREKAHGLGAPATPEEARERSTSRPRGKPHAEPWNLPGYGGEQGGGVPDQAERPAAAAPDTAAAAESAKPGLQLDHGTDEHRSLARTLDTPAEGARSEQPARGADDTGDNDNDGDHTDGPDASTEGPGHHPAEGDRPEGDQDPKRPDPGSRGDRMAVLDQHLNTAVTPPPPQPTFAPGGQDGEDGEAAMPRPLSGWFNEGDTGASQEPPVQPAPGPDQAAREHEGDAAARDSGTEDKPPLEFDHGTGEHESLATVSNPPRRATAADLETAEAAALRARQRREARARREPSENERSTEDAPPPADVGSVAEEVRRTAGAGAPQPTASPLGQRQRETGPTEEPEENVEAAAEDAALRARNRWAARRTGQERPTERTETAEDDREAEDASDTGGTGSHQPAAAPAPTPDTAAERTVPPDNAGEATQPTADSRRSEEPKDAEPVAKAVRQVAGAGASDSTEPSASEPSHPAYAPGLSRRSQRLSRSIRANRRRGPHDEAATAEPARETAVPGADAEPESGRVGEGSGVTPGDSRQGHIEGERNEGTPEGVEEGPRAAETTDTVDTGEGENAEQATQRETSEARPGPRTTAGATSRDTRDGEPAETSRDTEDTADDEAGPRRSPHAPSKPGMTTRAAGDDGVFNRVALNARRISHLFGQPAPGEPPRPPEEPSSASTPGAPAKPTKGPSREKPALQLDHGTGEQRRLTEQPSGNGAPAENRQDRHDRPATDAPDAPAGEGSTRGWRRLARVVTGGSTAAPTFDLPEHDIQRVRAPIDAPRRVVVLGCTGGAGQSLTTLLLGHTLAAYRDERVVAVDVNPGAGGMSRRIRTDTTETVTSLLANSDAISGYMAMRGYTSTQSRTGLEVVATLDDPYVQTLDDRDFSTLTGLLGEYYGVTLLDPAATGVARALPIVDGLVLVVPASGDAARAVAMTFEWLDGHGYSHLRSRAIVAVNGVSKRSLTDVEEAERVARGRCRAIVRIPWDDHLTTPHGAVDVKALRSTTRRSHGALAGVLMNGFRAGDAEAGGDGHGGAAGPASGSRTTQEANR
ncbi:conjugal transfer protein [Halostreptopolyspora alba]|uniref:Conjugal transfer protein n=1 Tax=Halostreptopolyspora alba TaxID=2487137 RepID=A0A3N0E416_9ACTN|nr:conjugal transfer protein [Nocardiopsaceae bacterium YIM 96095]